MSEPSVAQHRVGPADRVPVASFDNYAEAERAVDYLSDRKFQVDRVAIVGHDVKYVEQIIGRLNYGRAALSGAVTGGLIGALFGWIFGLLDWIRPLVVSLQLAAYGLIYGAVFGALLGIALYALQRGRRDFAAVRGMQPSRYDVVVDTAVAEDAARLLRERTA